MLLAVEGQITFWLRSIDEKCMECRVGLHDMDRFVAFIFEKANDFKCNMHITKYFKSHAAMFILLPETSNLAYSKLARRSSFYVRKNKAE